ncbi:MAG TPA: DEAD/DEAH box helicase [Candidatus Binatia bacterium]
MPIDPSKLTRNLKRDYRSYLESRFFFKSESLRAQFSEQIAADDRLFSGPYLELNPPFATGKTVRQLAAEGALSSSLVDLNPEALPPDRPLYLHQERAIERMAVGRNVLVATGTGSGKTETYLLPILSHLLEERRAGTLSQTGVRTLLLYPMNALANDQLRRIRTLLTFCPDITFGRYIGETPRRSEDARRLFRKLWLNEPMLRNELKSREEMWERPPHILVTNFAMLEYLLVRPQDSPFFAPEAASLWRFLVLDEVHSYDGAKGTEIAMLLRRLKARAGIATTGQLRCVGSSATLGGSNRDRTDVASFASALFGEPFGRDPESGAIDVIEAVRIAPPREADERPGSAAGFYSRLASLVEGDAISFDALSAVLYDGEANLPPDVAERALEALRAVGAPPTAASTPDARQGDEWDWGVNEPSGSTGHTSLADVDISAGLYEILRADARIRLLREACAHGPREVGEVAEKVFEEEPLERPARLNALLALISLATRASGGATRAPLLTARYHFFVRALEGGFVCLGDHDGRGPRLHLERRKTCASCEGLGVFEIGACRRCGEEILVGTLSDESGVVRLSSEDPTQAALLEEERGKRAFFSLRVWTAPAENEDELALDEANPAGLGDDTSARPASPLECAESPAERAAAARSSSAGTPEFPRVRLCRACGAVEVPDRPLLCGCPEEAAIEVTRLPSRGRELQQCPSCGSRSLQRDVLQTLYTGTDEPVAEVATTLFQVLNEGVVRHGEPKRKLLTFSDSRQDAAYFAPYLETLYRRALRSHMILSVVERSNRPVPIGDLAQRLVTMVEKQEWLGRSATTGDIEREVWGWLLAELMHSAKDRRGLEAMGLVDFRLRRRCDVLPPQPLFKAPWLLSPEEAWSVVQILVDSLRDAYCMTLVADVRPDAAVFAPARAGRSVVLQRAPNDRYSLAWCPQRRESSNARLDYLRRLVERRQIPLSDDQLRTFLREMFDRYMTRAGSSFLLAYMDQPASRHGGGILYSLRPHEWEVVPAGMLKQFRCNHCGIFSAHSVSGVCPTYRCEGTLEEVQDAERFDARAHVRDRYHRMREIWMVAREHTAQLDSLSAAETQSRFSDGDIDVLSCSTTFELGVDLGELDTILMRNMPPTPANYAQRAGRAGRRLGAAAVVVTYAQRRSHDLSFFRAPLRMISGRVRPPTFRLDNLQIVRRHLFATAFGSFFQHDPSAFGSGDAAALLQRTEPGEDGVARFERYLRERPSTLARELRVVVPPELSEVLQLDSWGWVDELIGTREESRRVSLRDVQAEFETDCRRYREAEIGASEARQHKKAALFQYLRHTVERRPLLGVLANRGLFPKYGFPVDVVGLAIDPQARKAASDSGEEIGLDLTRDLALAIAEYAPGAEVVAAGHVWRSAGLKVLPERRLEETRYFECDCGTVVTARGTNEITECSGCGQAVQRGMRRYIRPEFGFVTSDEKPRRSGTRRPERQYASRIAFESYVGGAAPEFIERWPGLRIGRPLVGRFLTINKGRGVGFRLCQDCGFAEPVILALRRSRSREHRRPHGGMCRGQLTWGVDLGHDFLTDVLELRIDPALAPFPSNWASIAYAILEGVTQALGIRREDLNATWRRGRDDNGCVFLYDAVPGGAGHVARIYEHMPNALAEALRRVSECSCEETTSCYECLRSFGNQRFHTQLSRGVAKTFLESVLGVAAVAARRRRQPAGAEQAVLSLINDEELREAIQQLIAGGTPLPQVGYEVVDGTGRVVAELEVAWPSARVGVYVDPVDEVETLGHWTLFAVKSACEQLDDIRRALSVAA